VTTANTATSPDGGRSSPSRSFTRKSRGYDHPPREKWSNELRLLFITGRTMRLDDYVVAPEERGWRCTPLEALAGRAPKKLIADDRIRDLVIKSDRLREGQPVWLSMPNSTLQSSIG
jgi:hypothetical protein